MEFLPSPRNETQQILTDIIESEETEKTRFDNLQDAMMLARQNLAFQDIEEYNDPDRYGYVQEIENVTGKSLLDPQWKSEPDDDRWNRRTKARARKAAVSRYWLMGYSIHQISNMVKVSEVTVLSDINSASVEWRKSYLGDIEELAARDLARLDEMFQKLTSGIEKGDVKSIRAGVEVIKERGNILGYRQGVQIDIEEHIRQIAAGQGMDPEKAVEMAKRISIRYS